MRDVLDLQPFPADDTADVLHQAIAQLARHRGLDHHPDPAARLHLLVSLQQQLQTELLHAVLVANHRGYTPDQIALLLDHAA